jgi:hypothetical protein
MTKEEYKAKFDEARAREVWAVAVDLQKEVLELREEKRLKHSRPCGRHKIIACVDPFDDHTW